MKHGKGVFIWNDGEKYDGEYVCGRKEGKGVYTWSGGKKYDGQWKDD